MSHSYLCELHLNIEFNTVANTEDGEQLRGEMHTPERVLYTLSVFLSDNLDKYFINIP